MEVMTWNMGVVYLACGGREAATAVEKIHFHFANLSDVLAARLFGSLFFLKLEYIRDFQPRWFVNVLSMQCEVVTRGECLYRPAACN